MEDPEDMQAREAAMQKMLQKQKNSQQGLPPDIDMTALQDARTNEERQRLLSKIGNVKAPKPQGTGMALGFVFVIVIFEGCDARRARTHRANAARRTHLLTHL